MAESRAQSLDGVTLHSVNGPNLEVKKPISGSLLKKKGSSIQSADRNSSGNRKSVRIILDHDELKLKSKNRIAMAHKKLMSDSKTGRDRIINHLPKDNMILVENESPKHSERTFIVLKKNQ